MPVLRSLMPCAASVQARSDAPGKGVDVRADGAWSAFGGAMTGEDLLSKRKMQQPNAAWRNHRF